MRALPAIDRETKNLLNERKRIHRKLNLPGLPYQRITELCSYSKVLNAAINIKLSATISKSFHRILESIPPNTDAFKIVKRISSYKRKDPTPTTLYHNNNKDSTITGTKNIANALVEQFSDNHSLPSTQSSPYDEIVANTMNGIINSRHQITFSKTVPAKIENHKQLEQINELIPDVQKNLLISTESTIQVLKNMKAK